MNKPALLTAGAFFLAIGCFAIGRFTAPVDAIIQEEIDLKSGGTVIDADKEALLRRLNDQIAALRQREAALQAQIVAQEQPQPEKAQEEQPAVAQAQPQPEQPRRGPPSAAERQAWLEKFKTENPEEYQRMMNWRNAIVADAENRANFLANVDIRLLTGEQRETHTLFMEKLALANETREKFEKGEEITVNMRELMGELDQLRHAERDILLQAAGRSAGYNRADSENFAATIKEIIQVTDRPAGPGRRGGRGR